MTWRECTTQKEFLLKGLTQASGFYTGTGLIFFFMSVALKPSPVAFVSTLNYSIIVPLYPSDDLA